MSRWTPNRPEYYVQTGGMHENPYGVPRDEIVRMLLENPAEVSAQVIFGKYVESSGAVFTSELIQRMFDRQARWYEGGWDRKFRVLGNHWVYRPAVEEAAATFRHAGGEWTDRYHTGVDFARQTDYTVITTIDTLTRPARIVYWKRLNRVPWETIYTEVGIARMLFGPHILCDGTGPGGDVVMDELGSRAFCTEHRRTILVGTRCLDADNRPLGCSPESYLSLACCGDYDFNGGRKKELVEHLRNVLSVGYRFDEPELEYGWLRSPPIVQLEDELSFYFWEDKRLETDCLFSLALAALSGLHDVPQPALVGSIHGG